MEYSRELFVVAQEDEFEESTEKELVIGVLSVIIKEAVHRVFVLFIHDAFRFYMYYLESGKLEELLNIFRYH